MKLIDDAGTVLRKAWSVRFMVLAMLFSGMEAVLPMLAPSYTSGPFLLASFVVTALALLFRFISQPAMRNG